MGLFSIFSKNKQEQPATDEGHFSSRAADESSAVRNRNKRGAGRKGGAGREDDETLTEKKRARRRLVGAVALVLAVIIGLPMIFDSEPKPLASDIAIQIPAKEKPAAAPAPAAAETAAPAATTAAAGSAVPNPESLDANEEIVEPAKDADKRAVATVNADGKALPIKPAATGTADKAVAAKTATTDKAVAAKTATADKAVAAKSATADKTLAAKTTTADKSKTADAQRAANILDGKPETKAADARGGKFMVRVSALATPEKITELRSKLSAAGFKSSTQKIDAQSGELTRVLVGPFATKEEAEKTRAKLTKAGLPAGQLVAL
jgi:DedD protein